jgi:Xaa-Pro aminopeptidase
VPAGSVTLVSARIDPIDEQLLRRQAAAASIWGLTDELVLVGAGEPVHIPGRGDITYPFQAHTEYLYLTDRNRAGGVLAFDPAAGWFDFVAPITREEMLWSGAQPGDQEGLALDELARWLAARQGRRVAALGAPVASLESDEALTRDLRYELEAVRRPKDAVEIDRMRAAERATRAGFTAIRPLLRQGTTEREIKIELEASFLRNGADGLAFDTIVASGPNSAVLHFPPTDRQLQRGDLVLIDAGGEHRAYASDITRTYPVDGPFTTEQRELHDIVHNAGLTAIERCAAGVEFWDVHRAGALALAAGLIELGLLRGDPESLFERGAVGLFFPHGIGHLLGLGVRDAGGGLPDRQPEEGQRARLRVDLPLLPGFVVTIEPGIYFVEALLRDPEARRAYRDAVDWAAVDRMIGFGGIRIEDNVLITETGIEVLTEQLPIL